MTQDVLGEGAGVAALLDGVGDGGERPPRVGLDQRLDELVERCPLVEVATRRCRQLEFGQSVDVLSVSVL